MGTLAVACRDHEIITFDYTTRADTTVPRRVEPQHLVASGDLWYLLAHDAVRDDWRIFRLDRTAGVTVTGRRVPARDLPGGDPAAFVAARLSAAPTRHRAVATVHASAEHVRARTRNLATRIRPLDQTTCLVDASDDSLTRIAQTLAGLPADYSLDADPTSSTTSGPPRTAPCTPRSERPAAVRALGHSRCPVRSRARRRSPGSNQSPPRLRPRRRPARKRRGRTLPGGRIE